MKCHIFTIWIAFSFLSPIYGQFATDFSEGHLDAWEGDKANFLINAAEQLQLNAPSGSTSSWLYTPLTYSDSMVWEFYIKLDFAPSTSNQLRVFLGLTSNDLATASGYFLEIGASGDQDPIELKYRDSGSDELIAASAPGIAGSEPVEFRLRITRDGEGMWTCLNLNGAVPEILFSAQHTLLPLSALSHFGLNCKYTDTRRDKFFFDDISINPPTPDVTPPMWTDLIIVDDQSLLLSFDEPIDPNTGLTLSHYTLSPGNIQPVQAEAAQTNITLHFSAPFESQTPYTLKVENLTDAAGNAMPTTERSFTYVRIDQAVTNELLITEIMADPTPSVGLPDAEYVELFNPTSKLFRLSDYMLLTGTSERALPDSLISGGTYVILCDPDDAGALSTFGRVVAVNNFSSLTNSGATLQVQDMTGAVIHEVAYRDTWYGDPEKSEGGWSLEMINPLAVCSAMDNWRASTQLSGGTPGAVNSVWMVSTDSSGPALLTLNATTDNTITLRFNESLDPVLMENPEAYILQPAVEIMSVAVLEKTTLQLTLATTLEPGVVYSFLPFTAFDCLGNWSTITDTLEFGLATEPDSGDLLIHEILFNPASGGSRFVEVINVSQKFIPLSSLVIGRIRGGQQDLYPTGIQENIAPGGIVAFSPEPSDIDGRYTVPFPAVLYEASLPSWDDETDNVTLLYNGELLDSLTYSDSWHLPVLADQNGVSLERISVLSPSGMASNWTSAASTAGYATPTGENSQQLVPETPGETPFTVTNRQFSPDGDGYKDFLALNFLLPDGDQLATIQVFDLEGHEIVQLISNETIGSAGIVQWDGRNADGGLAEMGIYVIFVQLWDTQGNVEAYRETCALVKR